MTQPGVSGSTRGGGTIARTAVAVQSASLLSLPLVLPRSLQLLGNPLAQLHASFGLAVLEPALAALSAATQDGPVRTARPGAATAPPPPRGTPGAQASSTRSPAVARAHGSSSGRTASRSAAAASTAASSPQARRAAAGQPLTSSAVQRTPLLSPATAPGPHPEPAGQRATAPQSAWPSTAEPGAGTAPPTPESLPSWSNSGLMEAARGATSTPEHEPSAPRRPASAGRTTPEPLDTPAAPHHASATPAPDIAAPDFAASAFAPPTEAAPTGLSGSPAFAASTAPGALAELVGRWSQASATEPGGAAASAAPLPPLAAAARALQPAPAAQPDLDGLEAAIGELLRRDLERHGLEGGLQ